MSTEKLAAAAVHMLLVQLPPKLVQTMMIAASFSIFVFPLAWGITGDLRLAAQATAIVFGAIGLPVFAWQIYRLLTMRYRFGVLWDGETPCCVKCRSRLLPNPSRFAGGMNGVRVSYSSIHTLTCPHCGTRHQLTRGDGSAIDFEEARRLIAR